MKGRRKPPRTIEDPALIKVTARLYAADVDNLKAQARAEGRLDWQPKLRLLVHEALSTRRMIK